MSSSGVAFAWIMLGLSSPAQLSAQPADDDPTTASITQQDALEELISALGSPDFQQRKQATETLKAKDKSLLETLKRAYRSVDDHEVRLRIREIAEAIIYTEALHPLGGFLGIAPERIDRKQDQRLAADQSAVRINRVLAHTAASRAGLQPGDLILEVNGQPLAVEETAEFIELIGSNPPAAGLRLSLLRGQKRWVEQITLRVRPSAYTTPYDPKHFECLQKAAREFANWSRDLE